MNNTKAVIQLLDNHEEEFYMHIQGRETIGLEIERLLYQKDPKIALLEVVIAGREHIAQELSEVIRCHLGGCDEYSI